MDILYFLKGKIDVVYVYDDDTVKEALKKLEPNHYSAIPIINHNDEYIGTLTEGDILWTLKKTKGEGIDSMLIKDIEHFRNNKPIYKNEKMINLLSRAIDENFVPVIDEKNRFIGIITRKKILEYFFERKFVVL